MPVKRGLAVWISGFLTLLAVLSTFGTLVYWVSEGPSFVLRPYLVGGIIGNLVGNLTVENYFWICLLTTFMFLGVTCIIAYRKMPIDLEIIKMFVKVGGNLESLKKTHETRAQVLAENIENNKRTNLEFFKKVNKNLEDAKKETLTSLEKQKNTLQKVRREMVSTVETKVGETRKEMFGAIKKQETAIRKVRHLSKQGTKSLKEQRAELEDIKIRLESIEDILIPPKPSLKSQDTPEELKGVGTRLGGELRAIGVTNIGKLITADPAFIDEKTQLSRDTAERLQATAQLLMIPGVDKNDAELLLESGITSRSELADQDLIQLSRKIGENFKTFVKERKISKSANPTIEEISSWIRMARH